MIADLVPLALKALDELCTDAVDSGKHTAGDWRDSTMNLAHMVNHYQNWSNGAHDEDHLLNMVCRGLFLLQLREELKGG